MQAHIAIRDSAPAPQVLGYTHQHAFEMAEGARFEPDTPMAEPGPWHVYLGQDRIGAPAVYVHAEHVELLRQRLPTTALGQSEACATTRDGRVVLVVVFDCG